MARTVEITKVSVKTSQRKLFAVTLHMKYLENGTVLFEQDFTENHWDGAAPSIVVNNFKFAMQQAINDYKAELDIFNATALNNAITALQNGLEV